MQSLSPPWGRLYGRTVVGKKSQRRWENENTRARLTSSINLTGKVSILTFFLKESGAINILGFCYT